MNARVVFTLAALLLAGPACAESKGRLNLPEFAALADKASETVTVTFDAKLLGIAAALPQQRGPRAGGRQETRLLAHGSLRAPLHLRLRLCVSQSATSRACAVS